MYYENTSERANQKNVSHAICAYKRAQINVSSSSLIIKVIHEVSSNGQAR